MISWIPNQVGILHMLCPLGRHDSNAPVPSQPSAATAVITRPIVNLWRDGVPVESTNSILQMHSSESAYTFLLRFKQGIDVSTEVAIAIEEYPRAVIINESPIAPEGQDHTAPRSQ